MYPSKLKPSFSYKFPVLCCVHLLSANDLIWLGLYFLMNHCSIFPATPGQENVVFVAYRTSCQFPAFCSLVNSMAATISPSYSAFSVIVDDIGPWMWYLYSKYSTSLFKHSLIVTLLPYAFLVGLLHPRIDLSLSSTISRCSTHSSSNMCISLTLASSHCNVLFRW